MGTSEIITALSTHLSSNQHCQSSEEKLLILYVCVSLCTTVVHNTAQNSSHNFLMQRTIIFAQTLCTGEEMIVTTTILRPFFWDHLGEPVPEENFWTLWCKRRSTEADTPTVWMGATPSGLTSAHLHHNPIFFAGRMLFLPPNQQCQSTEERE